MTIDELAALPDCETVAVDNTTGHAIAIIRVKGCYRLLDGNSVTTPHASEIPHQGGGGNIFSINEVEQMFATRKLSVLRTNRQLRRHSR